jgi:hypothetical protein
LALSTSAILNSNIVFFTMAFVFTNIWFIYFTDQRNSQYSRFLAISCVNWIAIFIMHVLNNV